MTPSERSGKYPTSTSTAVLDSVPPPGNLPASPTASQSTQHRGQSLVQNVITGETPLGVWQAIGEMGSQIPKLSEIHDGSHGQECWSEAGRSIHRGKPSQETHRAVRGSRRNTELLRPEDDAFEGFLPSVSDEYAQSLEEEGTMRKETRIWQHSYIKTSNDLITNMEKNHIDNVDIVEISPPLQGPDKDGYYPNGYRFPEKSTWTQSIGIASKAFLQFLTTLKGFLFIVYCLNVVGWGAMIFFALLNATPAMCHPSCNDEYSPRRIWIEIDAQILTALFCVPAFGLIPRRFRDFYYLMSWRLGNNVESHRKLAGFYRTWYRLPGSKSLDPKIGPLPTNNGGESGLGNVVISWSQRELQAFTKDPALPLPLEKIPKAPLTGIRANTTKSWNLDIVICMYMLNTWIQGALCGIMWGMTRFTRPSWVTGFLISIGCITGMVGGLVEFTQGSQVKKIEGVPVRQEIRRDSDTERCSEYSESGNEGGVRPRESE